MNFKIKNFHWFGKGDKIGSMSPHPWFLLLNIKYDASTVNAEMLHYFTENMYDKQLMSFNPTTHGEGGQFDLHFISMSITA